MTKRSVSALMSIIACIVVSSLLTHYPAWVWYVPIMIEGAILQWWIWGKYE